jgi:hypothetical protein
MTTRQSVRPATCVRAESGNRDNAARITRRSARTAPIAQKASGFYFIADKTIRRSAQPATRARAESGSLDIAARITRLSAQPAFHVRAYKAK